MPNGHGGYPYMGSPLALVLAFGLLLLNTRGGAGGMWVVVAGTVIAAAFGWRLAYHLHMRHLDEYGGAMATAQERQQGLARYRVRAALYAAVAAALALAGFWLRGPFGA